METWYRQDYDRWPDTHGHAPVTDLDFWLVMDGSVPTGTGVPFEHAEFELIRYLFNRRTLGAFLLGFGTGVLIPGPFDVIAAGVGAAVGGPAGAVVGIVAYNAFGISMVLLGAYLMGAPIPSFPSFDWDRVDLSVPDVDFGGSPMEPIWMSF